VKKENKRSTLNELVASTSAPRNQKSTNLGKKSDLGGSQRREYQAEGKNWQRDHHIAINAFEKLKTYGKCLLLRSKEWKRE